MDHRSKRVRASSSTSSYDGRKGDADQGKRHDAEKNNSRTSQYAVPQGVVQHETFLLPPTLPTHNQQAMIHRVVTYTKKTQPENTRVSYDPKRLEFESFCKYKYNNNSPQQSHSISTSSCPRSVDLVTPEATYAFLWYQAHRSKRNTKKHYATLLEEGKEVFDADDYESVVKRYAVLSPLGEAAEEVQNPVGPDFLNSCLGAIREKYMVQVSEHSNTYRWDEIRNQNVQDLIRMAKKRAPYIKRATYQEKLDSQFTPYLYAEHIPEIETVLWNRHNQTHRSIFSCLRNRSMFLTTTAGILRGESLAKSELSDLLEITVNTKKDPHPLEIQILQIPMGKTNQEGRTLFGRALRHLDPNLCAWGSTALYLLWRFHVSGEMQPAPDFNCNEDWFHIKLLVDANVSRETNTKSIQDKNYEKVIKEACQHLKIPAKHFLHFGRVAGSALLEFMEVQQDDIKRLGNWDPDTQEKIYSTKLPLAAMRAMAGFPTERGLHFNLRTSLEPPERLQRLIFPFIEDSIASLSSGDEKFTALHFLKYLQKSRRIILQDAAVMQIQGRNHPVFNVDVFKTPEFEEFRVQMDGHLKSSPHPADIALNTIWPRADQRLSNLQSSVTCIQESMTHFHESMTRQLQVMNATIAGTTARNANAQNYLLQAAGALGQNSSFTKGVQGTNNSNSQGQIGRTNTVGVDTSQNVVATAGIFESGLSTSSTICVRNYRLFPRHVSATGMYNEWYGEGHFANQPIPGGIAAAENQCGPSWRQHFGTAEQKQFSRLRQIIRAMEHQIEANRKNKEDIFKEFDTLLRSKSKPSLSGLVDTLKEKGYIVDSKRK